MKLYIPQLILSRSQSEDEGRVLRTPPLKPGWTNLDSVRKNIVIVVWMGSSSGIHLILIGTLVLLEYLKTTKYWFKIVFNSIPIINHLQCAWKTFSFWMAAPSLLSRWSRFPRIATRRLILPQRHGTKSKNLDRLFSTWSPQRAKLFTGSTPDSETFLTKSSQNLLYNNSRRISFFPIALGQASLCSFIRSELCYCWGSIL